MSIQIETLALWLAMALYAGATVLYAYHFLSKRAAFSWYATFLTGAGLIAHTASIGFHSSVLERSRLYGPYSMVLAAWALVLVYFVVEHLVRLKVYGVVLVPVALMLLFASQLLRNLSGSVGPNPEELAQLASWSVGVHVALIAFGNAGFAIGAAASAAYLGLERQLKRHNTATLFKRLPSLAQTDLVARRAVSFAFPVYATGLMFGILRAVETDVAGWWADPRVIVSGIVFAVFAVYLFLHYGRDVSGKTTAWVALLGFVFVVLLSILARTVPAGFHLFAIAGS